MEQTKNFLDKKYGNIIKGIAAVCVMLGHYTQEPPIYVFKWVNYLFPGSLWVAIFFFFSGYGLSYSYEHKNDYLKGFLSKKLINIYLPFFFAESAYTIAQALIDKNYNVKDIALGCIGIKLNNGVLWYIIELLVIYLLFYLDKKLLNKRNTLPIWLGLYFIFLLISVYFDIGTHWYMSSITIVIGLFYNKFEILLKKAIKVVGDKLYGMIVLLSFIVLYIVRCIILYYQISISFIKYTYIVTAFNIILAPLFVLFIMEVASKVKYKQNKYLISLGDTSYEIYLWHMFSFIIMSKLVPNYILSIITSLIMTIVLSFIFSKIDKKIQIK